MRYILLDRITTLEPPDIARGVKCVSLAEDTFMDHFPGHPIMPGALILEASLNNDIALLEACAMVAVCVAVTTQTIADIGYTFLNPRIRSDLSFPGDRNLAWASAKALIRARWNR